MLSQLMLKERGDCWAAIRASLHRCLFNTSKLISPERGQVHCAYKTGTAREGETAKYSLQSQRLLTSSGSKELSG